LPEKSEASLKNVLRNLLQLKQNKRFHLNADFFGIAQTKNFFALCKTCCLVTVIENITLTKALFGLAL